MTSRTFASEMEAILERFVRGAKHDKMRGKALNEDLEGALEDYEKLKKEKEKIQPYLDQG